MIRYFIIALVLMSCGNDITTTLPIKQLQESHYIIVENDTLFLDTALYNDEPINEKTAFITYEEPAEIVMGVQESSDLIKKHLTNLNCKSQTIFIQGLVTKAGKFEKVSLLKGDLDDNCKSKVIEIVSELKFKPGRFDRKPVDTRMVFPFKI